MVIIGVDSSGHVKNPPIWMVATRRSRKSGQRYYSVYISDRKHKKLANSCSDWENKISAILIYKSIFPIFYEFDSIFIDKDFQGKTCKTTERYLKKLLRASYPRKESMANPTVYFIPDNKSIEVKDAHIKTQKVRSKKLKIFEKDPSFQHELNILR
jgi:hypothetical protein